ncbi:hypothetical protein GTY44_23200, partial [Streptomyces sp. SID5914]|nr:hypothetical protein [Streptomyces sp. SID5914]
MSNEQQNRQKVERLYELFRTGDVDAFDELIDEDYVQHNPFVGQGRKAMKEIFRAFGPLDIVVHRTLADNDLVAAHINCRTWNIAAID